MRGKIKDIESLLRELEHAKASGRSVGFTNGCFDVIHAGHVRYLEEARRNCDVLVVGVNSDSSVRRIKGPTRPVNGEQDRMEVLSALASVDLVSLFEEDTPELMIKEVRPDVLFKGGDWQEEDVVGADFVKKTGGKVMIVRYEDGFSTTGIIDRIKRTERDNG